jgi:hypothetical protein
MRRKLTWFIAIAFLVTAGLILLKLTIPLSYANAELNSPAVDFVTELQKSGAIDPEECAARYTYFNTDYHTETPNRIRIVTKRLSEDRVRVTLHDPSCRCDSRHSSIDRIYLERNSDRIWIPIRHEWSHTGRGRFGWTTEPTT